MLVLIGVLGLGGWALGGPPDEPPVDQLPRERRTPRTPYVAPPLWVVEEGQTVRAVAALEAGASDDRRLDVPPTIERDSDRSLLDRWVFQTDAVVRVPEAETVTQLVRD